MEDLSIEDIAIVSPEMAAISTGGQSVADDEKWKN